MKAGNTGITSKFADISFGGGSQNTSKFKMYPSYMNSIHEQIIPFLL